MNKEQEILRAKAWAFDNKYTGYEIYSAWVNAVNSGNVVITALNDKGQSWLDLPQHLLVELMRDYHRQTEIQLTWSVDDVLSEEVRPDLTEDQAWQVLMSVEENHDADYGVCWDTLRITADEMFPEVKLINVLFVPVGASPFMREVNNELHDLQHLVGGDIETVLFDRESATMVCHEEGKLIPLQPCRSIENAETKLHMDTIYGDFFICGSNEGELVSLTPEQIERYTKEFENFIVYHDFNV